VAEHGAERRMHEHGRGTVTGQQQMRAAVVVAFAVRDRTQQRTAVQARRDTRQMRGDEHAVDIGALAGEVAADLRRSLWLAVEAVEVRHAAVEPDEDQGTRPSPRRVRECAHQKRQQSKAAEEVAAIDHR
jgi:hypothetical protein